MDERLLSKDFRINNLYKIKNKEKCVVPFRLNRAQQDFHLRHTNRNIILKSRQLGFSTYEAIDSLDDVLFIPNTEALMLSYDIPSQLDMFDNKVDFAWRNLHPSLSALYTLDADRANKLKFNFGDKSSSAISVKTHGRSGTFNRLHISEFAKICKNSTAIANEIISGTMPAVPLSGRIDIESTAENDTGHFHDMFMEAYTRPANLKPRPVEFTAFFYNWTYDDEELAKVTPEDPQTLPKEFQEYRTLHSLTSREITYYHYKWLSLNKNWHMLRREYPTTPEEAFTAAGDKFFDQTALSLMRVREPLYVADNGNWRYYADYRPNHRYAIAADPSEGVGRDNASIAVIDFDAKAPGSAGQTQPEVVAVYTSDKIAPDMFAHEIKNAATRYGNCIVAVERNNHGHATLAILKQMYYNLYKEVKFDTQEDRETERLGWPTNLHTKPKMLFDIATAINEQFINIPDQATVHEFKTYLRDDLNSVKRDPEVKHWDRVIAVSIAWQMRNYATGQRVVTSDSEQPMDRFSVVGSF